MDYSFLEKNKIVPVVVLKKTEDTVPVLSALKKGGINVAEITFRTECAGEAIALAIKEFPDMTIGAGTVINAEQCERAYSAGAKFIVSPGFRRRAQCLRKTRFALPCGCCYPYGNHNGKGARA